MELLVVVDAQKDFITGPLGSKEAEAALPNIVREVTDPSYGGIIFTLDTHEGNYLTTHEGTHLPVEHCIYPSEGWAMKQEVFDARQNQGKILIKTGFGSPELVNEIVNFNADENQAEKITDVTFVGYCTDVCVMVNALMVRGALPDLNVYYVPDAVAASSPEKKEAALAIFESCHIYPRPVKAVALEEQE